MEPSGSVASALPRAAAGVVSTVVVWGDGAAWCDMHCELVAAMGAAVGLQWFW